MKIWKQKYLIRLFTFGVLLGVTPIFAFGTFLYDRLSAATIDQIMSANNQVLLQKQLHAELVLKTIDNAITNFASSAVAQDYFDLSLTPDNFTEFREFTDEIAKLQAYDLGISEIIVENIAQDWILENDFIGRLSQSENKAYVADLLDLPYHSQWISDRQLFTPAAAGRAGSWTSRGVNLVKKLPYHSMITDVLMIIRLPNSVMVRVLNEDSINDEILVFDSTRMAVAAEDESILGTDLAENPFVQDILRQSDQAAGQFRKSVDNNLYLVAYRWSSYNNWCYVSLTPFTEIGQELKTIRLFIILSCLLAMLVIMIIAARRSGKIYQPIRNIYELLDRNQEGQPVAAPGIDELQLIKDRVENMVHDNKNLSALMQSQISQLQEHFLLRLLNGRVSSGNIPERLMALQLNQALAWQWIAVQIIQVVSLEETGFQKNDLELILFTAINAITEVIPADMICPPVVLDQSVVLIVGGKQESKIGFRHYCYSIAATVQATLREYMHIKVFIGISRILGNIAEVGKLHRETQEIIRDRIGGSRAEIILVDEVEAPAVSLPLYPVELEQALIMAIKQADLKTAEEELALFVQAVLSDGSLQNGQMMLLKLLVDLLILIQGHLETRTQLPKTVGQLYHDLSLLKSDQDAVHWFIANVIRPIVRIYEEMISNQQRTISDRLIQIVENEFEHDLTIENCASRFNYNADYLRRLFRKETGTTFSDYLQAYRMAMAKRWLEETDLKINEISERLRFTNPQNFIRSFRRLEKTTPGEYRKMKNK